MIVLLFWVLLMMMGVVDGNGMDDHLSQSSFSRDDFPEDFVFGSATSAYQMEGAAAEDGRTPSIWDTFQHSGKSPVAGTGDRTSDGYHKYKEDVKLMEKTGLDAYRFSISWSRLIPDGRGRINPKGLEYYNNLINELIKHGIEPHVTLLHFDVPQVLEDEYGGWLSPKVVVDFTEYADVCFREFGDRVSHWITINEANTIGFVGYGLGITPPGRCSNPFGIHNCSVGDSTSEPYIVSHHCILAHSSAATLYKRKYQAKQQGLICLNLLILSFQPVTNSTRDIAATERVQDFISGWFIEPLVRGDYPKIMRKNVGKKLPKFTKDQSKQIMASFDYIGMNYYYVIKVMDAPNNSPLYKRDVFGDASAKLLGGPFGGFVNEPTTAAKGLQERLEYFKQTCGNPPIYIYENGFGMPQKGPMDDVHRVQHLNAHLESLLAALRNGSNTKGYFTWSFVDVFELFDGYDNSYGMYCVDFDDDERKRYPKLSSSWYSNFLKRRGSSIITNNSLVSHAYTSTF